MSAPTRHGRPEYQHPYGQHQPPQHLHHSSHQLAHHQFQPAHTIPPSYPGPHGQALPHAFSPYGAHLPHHSGIPSSAAAAALPESGHYDPSHILGTGGGERGGVAVPTGGPNVNAPLAYQQTAQGLSFEQLANLGGFSASDLANWGAFGLAQGQAQLAATSGPTPSQTFSLPEHRDLASGHQSGHAPHQLPLKSEWISPSPSLQQPQQPHYLEQQRDPQGQQHQAHYHHQQQQNNTHQSGFAARKSEVDPSGSVRPDALRLPIDRSHLLPPTFSDSDDEKKGLPRPSASPAKLKIKLKRRPAKLDSNDAPKAAEGGAKMPVTRRSSGNHGGNASDVPQRPEEANGGAPSAGRPLRSSRTAASKRISYAESAGVGDDEDDPLALNEGEGGDDETIKARGHDDGEEDDDDDDGDGVQPTTRQTRSGRQVPVRSYREHEDDDDDDDDGGIKPTKRRNKTSSQMADFVADDEEDVDGDADFGSSGKKGKSRLVRGGSSRVAQLAAKRRGKSGGGRRRNSMLPSDFEEDDDAETPDEGSAGDEERNSDDPGGSQGRSYRLRERKKVNYSLVPAPDPPRDGFGRIVRSTRGSKSNGRSGNAFELDGLPTMPSLPFRGKKGKEGWDALPTSMSGKDYARLFGDEPDSSDDDIPAARKAGGGPALLGGAPGANGLIGTSGHAVAGGGSLGPDLATNRDAVGRLKGGVDAMADVDPLGVNMAIDFDSVGGLEGHVQQLKEMVSLPLLYPEVFQQFKVTPPRGVLFHGPPGTGKTLVARALAASCSSSGQQISFFMRKGADCLSKWVGEAERQLRLLFEEARNAQPSIIFFDEIDGLAPVRSSKQDQIHASIVSTLLALMDGMDGRGQVVVIGATNRPDSVDPALRRPGRFDREFYFPLPSRDARRSILDIHTRGWEPPLEPEFKDRLAEVTKGYGGADLRALCTEAALNAIQRRYPQIYQTTERLQLKPDTIRVEAKDFMMSVNKIVPSSARSSGSSAAPLPDHLRPLLQKAVDRAIVSLSKVMPQVSKRNPLEEALWEDEPLALPSGHGVDVGGFGREMLLQSFESLRVFRPRLLIHGERGMGQSLAGSALLHHLEGYHVQTLDIASLMGDSARTPEAAVVQLFVEAKRHKPSVIFIPGLAHWANTVSESVRGTTKALLDGLAPSDPVLLLAICEDRLDRLPRDVRAWFGYLRDNKVELGTPEVLQRQAYFAELMRHIERPPNAFPDALPRRKRVLEELPIAPPRPPREPTAAELAQQAADDQRLLEHLKYRLGPVLAELRKKYKQFCRDVNVEYNLEELMRNFEHRREKGKVVVKLLYDPTSHARRRRDSSAQAEDAELHALHQSQSQVQSAVASRGASVQPDVSNPPAAQPVEANGVAAAPGDEKADATMADGTAKETLQPNGAVGVDGVQPAVKVNGAAMAVSDELQSVAPPPSGQSITADASVPTAETPAPSQTAAPPSHLNLPPPPPGMRWDATGTYWTRDLVIFTLNLEKMQKKLYHNGYLTCAEFLDDVGKLVWNAEEAKEVDENRMVRAHQMRNLANVMMDQLIEAPFRLDCERMAKRVLAREEAKRKEHEAKAAAAAVAAASGTASGDAAASSSAPPKPAGERSSARVQGRAPEIGGNPDVMAIERKRSRSRRSSSRRASGGAADGAEEGGAAAADAEHSHKRARMELAAEADALADAAREDGLEPGGETVAAGGAQAQAQLAVPGAPSESGLRSSDAEATSTHTPVSQAIDGPATSVALNGAHGHGNDEVGTGTKNAGAAAQLAAAEATAVHPAFTLDRAKLDQLAAHLLDVSSGFSVEQLEQLRAACFGSVWRHRASWDRTELLEELEALADEVAEAAKLERGDEQEEGG